VQAGLRSCDSTMARRRLCRTLVGTNRSLASRCRLPRPARPGEPRHRAPVHLPASSHPWIRPGAKNGVNAAGAFDRLRRRLAKHDEPHALDGPEFPDGLPARPPPIELNRNEEWLGDQEIHPAIAIAEQCYFELAATSAALTPKLLLKTAVHVYLQMPGAMRVTEAPALLVQTKSGDTVLVNYRLRQHYYVVDKLFDTAVLVVGVGTHQERVTVRRTGATR
jgi:Conjugal transfer protein